MAICSPALAKHSCNIWTQRTRRPLKIEVLTENVPALRLYQSMGFFICGLVLKKCREMNPPSDGLLYGKTIKGRFEASFYCSIRFI